MYITPCVQLCTVDKDSNKCKGCGRTLDEIRKWSTFSDEERIQVMKRLGYLKRSEHRGKDGKRKRR